MILHASRGSSVFQPPPSRSKTQTPDIDIASSPRDVDSRDAADVKMDSADISLLVFFCTAILLCILARRRGTWGTWGSWSTCRSICGAKLAPKAGALPEYWENAGKAPGCVDRSSQDYFDDIYPVTLQNREMLQRFLNETSSNEEVHFQLVRAVRVEHSKLWFEYQSLAQEVARRRRKPLFKGRGAPTTNRALAAVEGGWEGGFVHAVDEDICEAYLWHGTEPHSALKIVEGGFHVKHASRAGKRFGQGGYFSEDPAVADKYAGEGEGLYKGCYALLFCRVILGQQFYTTSFRNEEAADEARRRGCDSLLVERHGALHREFVVLHGSQIYPEYALVYERQGADYFFCPSPVNRYWADADCTAEQDALPAYWFHAAQQASGTFHETHPDHHMKAVLDELLSKTFLEDLPFDPGSPVSVRVTVGLRCLKAVRVEDSEMWQAYRAAQDAIALARAEGGEARDGRERLAALRPAVHTTAALPQRELRRLREELNEVYLFYGASPQQVMYIAQHGFPVTTEPDVDRLFGQGAYFHEDASEADKRSSDDKNGYYQGYFAMLLCRVTLGAVQVLQSPDAEAHLRVGPDKTFDSTMGMYGDRTSGTGMARREFVISDLSRVYPEYAVIYERDEKRRRSIRCAEQRTIASDRAEGERILLLA